jgi:hypothetical protein
MSSEIRNIMSALCETLMTVKYVEVLTIFWPMNEQF